MKNHVLFAGLLLLTSSSAMAAYDCNPQAAACTYSQADPRMASAVEWTTVHSQCSGTLLGRQTGATDSTLILTAAHCVATDSDVVNGYLQVTVYYLAAGACQPEGNLQNGRDVAGATWSGLAKVLVLDRTGADQHDATKLGKDVLLLQISNPPPSNTYLSGWNSNDVTGQNLTNLSHPTGLQTALAHGPAGRDQYGNSSIAFSFGAVDHGSSGSGAFDSNSKFAGVVQAGGCNATTPPTGGMTQLVDFYSEIKAYLDPNNTGVTSVSGYPAPVPPPTESISISPPSPMVGDTVTVSWTTTDASTCTANGDWSGNKPAAGVGVDAVSFQLRENRLYTYSLSCSNASGTTTSGASVYASNAGNSAGGSSSGGGAFGLATLIPMLLVGFGRKRPK